MVLIGASTGWIIGLVLGVVVALVAAAIVITIVVLATRIAKQARTAVERRREGARADRGAERDRANQRLGSPDPAFGARAAEGGGRKMIAIAALSNHGAWEIALVIGLVVALAVAGLLVLLVRAVGDIKRSVSSLLDVAGKVAGNTANIPQLEATAPVLGLIVEEAVVQDGYMNALTDGYGSGNGAR